MSEEEEMLELAPTAEEQKQQDMYSQYSFPTAVPQYNVHKFIHDVSVSDDTTKTGNVTEEELGVNIFTMRILKEVQTYCIMMGKPEYATYFSNKSEIISATSLSKEGFLDKLAVVTRQELGLIDKKRKKNRGWFGSKKKSQQPEVTEVAQ